MRKLAFLYFSAAGSTKLVAELLRDLLRRDHAETLEIELASVESGAAHEQLEAADYAVFLFPTYYLKPAPPMLSFVEGLEPSVGRKPCYLVASCELYTENCTRRLARALKTKGYLVTGTKTVRATGSDVTAALPSGLVPWLYRFGKGAAKRISEAAQEISSSLEAPREAIPVSRWYTPFTQLLQVAALNHFDLMRHRLRALEGRCTRCGLCVRECPCGALSMGERAAQAAPERCILCCRCVHVCPEKAIVLLKPLKDNRRIDRGLLEAIERDLRAELGLEAGSTGQRRK